jgi:hypothetical protein
VRGKHQLVIGDSVRNTHVIAQCVSIMWVVAGHHQLGIEVQRARLDVCSNHSVCRHGVWAAVRPAAFHCPASAAAGQCSLAHSPGLGMPRAFLDYFGTCICRASNREQCYSDSPTCLR